MFDDPFLFLKADEFAPDAILLQITGDRDELTNLLGCDLEVSGQRGGLALP